MDCCFGVRISGCSATATYWLVSGKCDAWILHEAKTWDMAAGFLAVEEAGGKVTDWDLNKTTPFHPHPIMTNGIIHEGLIKCLKK
jgi:myo-inositol-1(or 4)-monophosphatase